MTTATDTKKLESCQGCGFAIGDGRKLRCGFDYFQIPARERRSPKLTTFPEVAIDHVCERWNYVGASVLNQAIWHSPKSVDKYDVKTEMENLKCKGRNTQPSSRRRQLSR